jgi:putative membrane-bound dehydrogenase-like protein
MKNLIVILLLACATTASAAELGKKHRTSNAPFLKPKEALAKMDIPKGFDVSIFAAEPTIGEPIAFTFDDRGRIWVVENYNYVNRRAHKETNQVTRIQILEDTDSDGVFDKKKTFTDKLTFSSGIAVGFGGVYVGSPPHLTFIPDKNGDDKPDGPPEILLDGWGHHDRHETLNSFIWGPDGWLYGCHGVFTESHVGKPGTPMKDRTFIDAGIWRWHPTKKKFEMFARGLSNPWGFDFNDHGQGFATCCVIPHLFHVVQGGTYHKQSKPHLNPYVYDYIPTIRDHTHLSAHGGARFYLADAFPAKYRDQLFMCNIHQHQLLTDVMKPKGSSYIGSHGEDFISMNDLAWVGFSLETGPEGGVYILDWHDTDVCGNAINFPNSGRIYRVMPKGAKPIKRPNVGAMSDAELVKLQNHPNDWYVRQTRLHLQMRAASGKLNKPSTARQLEQMLTTAKTSGKKLRAMWALHVIGSLSEPRLHRLLGYGDEYIRAFAIQFLMEDKQPSVASLSRFASLAKTDKSPVVRLYLASALQRLPHEKRWPILANLSQHAEDTDDNNIPRMLWFALEPMVPENPDKALQLAMNSKLTKLQELTARRMVSGDLPARPARKKPTRSAKKDTRPTFPGKAPLAQQQQIQKVAPGFQAWDLGLRGAIPHKVFRNEFAIMTHPFSREKPARLVRHVEVPKGKKTTLKVRVSHHPHADWQLRVLAGKKVLKDTMVSSKTVGKDEWLTLEFDLSSYAGQHLDLTFECKANNWSNEWAYWSGVKVESR